MYKNITFLLLVLLTGNAQADSNDFTGKKIEFYKNKHLNLIKSKCIKTTEINKCLVSNIKEFYSGLKLLEEPKGDIYYKKCYSKNKNEGNFDYQSINNCSKNYFNILSYNFMGKKYNHIFLEESYIMNNLTQRCNSNVGSEINLNNINNCIKEQQESFKFFKLNFFNSLSLDVEDVFLFCVKKHEYGSYSFDFKSINQCIKKNTYNF